MNRWSAVAVAAAMAVGGLAAYWQRATAFPGDDLGFGPKPGRIRRIQSRRLAWTRPQDTNPRSAEIHRSVRFARPIRYVASFKFVDENDRLLARYPEMAYDLVVVGRGGKRTVKTSGLVTLDANGGTTLACTRPASSDPAYFTFRLIGESQGLPEWQFVAPTQVPYALPAPKIRKAKGKAGAVRVACAAPPVQLRRNLVDVAMRGLPPGAQVRVGEDVYPVHIGPTDLPTVSLPRESAESANLQMELLFEDENIARVALIDAGALLRSNGGRVDAYSVNTLNVPDDEWTLRRTELRGIALQSLTPSVGVVNGIGLYSEQQVVGLLGQPERREASLSFSRPDGGEWLHYPSKGLSVRVRALGGVGAPDSRAVELIKLTGPQGGTVGGVGVGAPAQELLDRFGTGDTTQRLGKPRAGFRSYLAEGIVFNLDPTSTAVQSVELWRPLPILAQALEPRPMALANQVYLGPPGEAGAEAVTGDAGQAVAKAFAKQADLLSARVGSSRSIRRVDAPDKADLAVGWRIVSLNAAFRGGILRGSASVEVTTTKSGGARAQRTLTASASVSRLGSNAEADLARRLYEELANPICDTIAGNFTFMNRVRSIDYRTGDVELDFGSEGTGLVPGVAFEPMNLTWPAFPDAVPTRSLATRFGPKELERGNGARIVLVVKSVGANSATARFAALVHQRGQPGQGFVERLVELAPKDWRPRIVRLLDPATGLLYVRLRPVFDLSPTPGSPAN